MTILYCYEKKDQTNKWLPNLPIICIRTVCRPHVWNLGSSDPFFSFLDVFLVTWSLLLLFGLICTLNVWSMEIKVVYLSFIKIEFGLFLNRDSDPFSIITGGWAYRTRQKCSPLQRETCVWIRKVNIVLLNLNCIWQCKKMCLTGYHCMTDWVGSTTQLLYNLRKTHGHMEPKRVLPATKQGSSISAHESALKSSTVHFLFTIRESINNFSYTT